MYHFLVVFLMASILLNSITATRARIETSIPRKHGPAIAGYETVWLVLLINYMTKLLFYFLLICTFCCSVGSQEVLWACFASKLFTRSYANVNMHTGNNWLMHYITWLKALLKHIDFEVVQCVVIASPGFTKVILTCLKGKQCTIQ